MIPFGFRLQKMRLTLNHFRILLAAIILIAGSALVSSASGVAGGEWEIAVEFSVADDSTAAAKTQDTHQDGCREDCSTNCMSSTGSSCCGASVAPLTSEREILDRASTSAYGLNAGLPRTGINPEALLQPPRFFA